MVCQSVDPRQTLVDETIAYRLSDDCLPDRSWRRLALRPSCLAPDVLTFAAARPAASGTEYTAPRNELVLKISCATWLIDPTNVRAAIRRLAEPAAQLSRVVFKPSEVIGEAVKRTNVPRRGEGRTTPGPCGEMAAL